MASAGHLRRAVIFGASGGLGQCVANEFAHHGWTVTALGRQHCDLASPDSVSAWLSSDVVGHAIDACVFCSGASEVGSLDDVPAEAFRRCLEINCLGPITIFLELARRTENPCRRFIFVLSGTADLQLPRLGPYSLAKRALRDILYLRRMEKSLAGAQVLSVWPGPMATDFNRKTVVYGKTRLPAAARARPAEAVAARIFAAFAAGKSTLRLSRLPGILGALQCVMPNLFGLLARRFSATPREREQA